MTIYLTQNGEKYGPFTLDEVQDLIRVGRAHENDLAWYEGQTTWVPLRDVPGFVNPRPARPIGVWIISILSFACAPFALLGVVMIALMQSGAIPVRPEQAEVFRQLGPVYYIVMLLNTALALTWTVLFFMLKRVAIWFYVASLGVGILYMIYNLAVHGTISPGSRSVVLTGIIMGVGWTINAALLYYNWHLIRKGVMR
jgi:hypothetical protein